jgi:cytosine/adenosine deaminase-related metal-dependent hydrolase
VLIDDAGTILDLAARDQFDAAELEIHQGVLVPGFINTHCHLELSHMKGKIPTGSGLLGFIGNVVKNRNADAEIILDAINTAEQEMLVNGIVAVGDISNTTDSFAQKIKGNLFYYTFVEFFDLFQDSNAQATYDQYSGVYDTLPDSARLKKSKVPHAPYSVSRTLFELLRTDSPDHTISVHNQETPPENELFETKTGGFIDFYNSFHLSTKNIPLLKKPSIHYALEYLSPENRTLFVHNTLSGPDDIAAAHNKLGLENCFWATCPNANLYIENRLPDYRIFTEAKAQVTIGTDSLTSNWQLNILEEMKVILKHHPDLGLETVLQWATINGARALGWGNQLGSLEKGKTPGLVLIENMENGHLTERSSSKRLA